MKTLQWTFLLAMQSNRSAEFFILDSPALIPKFPQSPSSSYLFSHFEYDAFDTTYFACSSFNRPQALTCFHTAAVFNAENLRLFKPQNTNLPHSEACLKILLHF